MAELLGRTLGGRFRVDAFLQKGGMAWVYRGTQLDDLRREVAVKVLLPSLVKDPKVAKRFLREIEATRRLSHENIVTTLAAGEEDGIHYLVMELLQGEELFAALRRDGRFSQRHAAQVIADVCAALEHAHARGVLHRDLKPENIMLVPSERSGEIVKVLDFGLAQMLTMPADPDAPPASERSVDTKLTSVGIILGTPTYVSPEQARAEPLDHRHDLYAAGVLLYELVTGKPPFEGATPLEVVMRHAREPPRPPGELAQVDPELEILILRALAKTPDERPPSAGAMRAELLAMLDRLPSSKQRTEKPARSASELRSHSTKVEVPTPRVAPQAGLTPNLTLEMAKPSEPADLEPDHPTLEMSESALARAERELLSALPHAVPLDPRDTTDRVVISPALQVPAPPAPPSFDARSRPEPPPAWAARPSADRHPTDPPRWSPAAQERARLKRLISLTIGASIAVAIMSLTVLGLTVAFLLKE